MHLDSATAAARADGNGRVETLRPVEHGLSSSSSPQPDGLCGLRSKVRAAPARGVVQRGPSRGDKPNLRVAGGPNPGRHCRGPACPSRPAPAPAAPPAFEQPRGAHAGRRRGRRRPAATLSHCLQALAGFELGTSPDGVRGASSNPPIERHVAGRKPQRRELIQLQLTPEAGSSAVSLVRRGWPCARRRASRRAWAAPDAQQATAR
jgi:hypothetical protein